MIALSPEARWQSWFVVLQQTGEMVRFGAKVCLHACSYEPWGVSLLVELGRTETPAEAEAHGASTEPVAITELLSKGRRFAGKLAPEGPEPPEPPEPVARYVFGEMEGMAFQLERNEGWVDDRLLFEKLDMGRAKVAVSAEVGGGQSREETDQPCYPRGRGRCRYEVEGRSSWACPGRACRPPTPGRGRLKGWCAGCRSCLPLSGRWQCGSHRTRCCCCCHRHRWRHYLCRGSP